MSNDKAKLAEFQELSQELCLEEFSITELEERLEFFPKCKINIPPA